MDGCNLTDVEFEALAEKVAKQISRHDTRGSEDDNHPLDNSRGILWRMWNGKKAAAYEYLNDFIKPKFYTKYNFDDDDKEAFFETVLAYLLNDGLEVEWNEGD